MQTVTIRASNLIVFDRQWTTSYWVIIQLKLLNSTSFELWVDFKNVTKTLNCRITLQSVNLEVKFVLLPIGSSQLPIEYDQI